MFKKDMGRTAVDIVLLPDEAMTNRAIELNAKLVERWLDFARHGELVEPFGRKIVLHKANCLPHISLAMGCIEVGDIGAIEKVLTAIAERCDVGKLKTLGIHTSTNLSDPLPRLAAGDAGACDSQDLYVDPVRNPC